MKKVKWRRDLRCYVPFCPYCNELAYEKDHCVFCEKEYKWVGKSKERIITVGEYTVFQASNNHITIVKDDSMVMHISCTKRKSKRWIKKMVELCTVLDDLPSDVKKEIKERAEQAKAVLSEKEDDSKSGVVKEKPRAEYMGFSSHDCESYYKCPVCLKTFGDMLIDSNDVRCPYCETELEGIE